MRLSPRANAKRLIAFKSVRMLNYKIINLAFHDLTDSTAIVPTSIKHVLGLGLKFCPTPPSIPTAFYTAALPALFRSIRLHYMFGGDDERHQRQSSSTTYNKLTYVPNPTFQLVDPKVK